MRQMCSLDTALREGRESDVLTLMSRGSIIDVVSYASTVTGAAEPVRLVRL